MWKKERKQNVEPKKRLSKSDTPQMLHNIHHQFFERMHNLDYLQWLQLNGMRYTASICILALMLSTATLWQSQDWPMGDEPKMVSQTENFENTEGQEDVSVPQSFNTVSEAEVSSAVGQESNTVHQEAASYETIFTYVDPLQLSGYQTPSSGPLLYSYGLGYDPIYEDYRYHREVCYEKGDGMVRACIDGEVRGVNLDQHWQLEIQSDQKVIRYAGLYTCDVSDGSIVKAGMPIGTTDNHIIIQAVIGK